MSETILKIFLEELKLLRIVCKKCAAVVEMDLAIFEQRATRSVVCPGCNQLIRDAKNPARDALESLASAHQELKALGNHFDFQFVIPATDKPATKSP